MSVSTPEINIIHYYRAAARIRVAYCPYTFKFKFCKLPGNKNIWKNGTFYGDTKI